MGGGCGGIRPSFFFSASSKWSSKAPKKYFFDKSMSKMSYRKYKNTSIELPFAFPRIFSCILGVPLHLHGEFKNTKTLKTRFSKNSPFQKSTDPPTGALCVCVLAPPVASASTQLPGLGRGAGVLCTGS
jgi:hypothetical protein